MENIEEVQKKYHLEYLEEKQKQFIEEIFAKIDKLKEKDNEIKEKRKTISKENEENWALRLKLREALIGELTEENKELIEAKDWHKLKEIYSKIKNISKEKEQN